MQDLSSGADHKCYIITKLDNDSSLTSTSYSLPITTNYVGVYYLSTLYTILPISVADNSYATVSNLTSTISSGTGIYTYLNGTYDISASSFSTDGPDYPYLLINNSLSKFWGCGYSGASYNSIRNSVNYSTVPSYTQMPYKPSTDANAGQYRGGTSGSTTTNFWTTTVSSQTISGEWWQVKFPYYVKLYDLSFNPRDGTSGRYVKLYYVAGSNDGTTWDLLGSQTNTNSMGTSLVINSSSGYKYFRIIISSTYNQNLLDMAKLYMRGYISSS